MSGKARKRGMFAVHTHVLSLLAEIELRFETVPYERGIQSSIDRYTGQPLEFNEDTI